MEDPRLVLSCWIPSGTPISSPPSYLQWLCSAVLLRRDFFVNRQVGKTHKTPPVASNQKLGKAELCPCLWQAWDAGMFLWHHGMDFFPPPPPKHETSQKPHVWWSSAGSSAAREPGARMWLLIQKRIKCCHPIAPQNHHPAQHGWQVSFSRMSEVNFWLGGMVWRNQSFYCALWA